MADKPIAHTIEKLTQSIELLESRHAFQDDIIEQLNQEITLHQIAISQLKEQIQMLAKRVKDSPSSTQVVDLADDTPPPHY
ncbi:SlyX family protein [Thalassotalea piscium]